MDGLFGTPLRENAMPFHIRRTLLCDSLDTIRLPSFGPYPPSLIC